MNFSKVFCLLAIVINVFLSISRGQCQCNYAIDSTYGKELNGKEIIDSLLLSSLTFPGIIINNSMDLLITGATSDSSKKFIGSVIKLDKFGQLDKSFGNSGKFEVKDVLTSIIHHGIELPTKEYLITGNYGAEVYLAKIDQNGKLSNNFGNNGVFRYRSNLTFGSGRVIKILPTGDILLGGVVQGSKPNVFIIKLKNNGIIDSTFAENGVFIVSTSYENIFLELDNDKILLAYSTGSGNLSNVVLTKLNKFGNIDSTFGQNGNLVIDRGQGDLLKFISKINTGEYLLFGSIQYGSGKSGAFISKISEKGELNYNFDAKGYKIYNNYLPSKGIICGNKLLIFTNEHDGKVLFFNHSLIDIETGNIDTTVGENGNLKIYFDEDMKFPFFLIDYKKIDNFIQVIGHNTYSRYIVSQLKLKSPNKINHLQDSNKIKVVPSIVKDEIGLFGDFNNERAQIKIINLSGNSVKQFDINLSDGELINVDDLGSGHYIIYINIAKTNYKQRFIKL